MDFLEAVTTRRGFRFVSDPNVPVTLRGHAAILAEEVLRCLRTYSHKIHHDDDPRQPIMEYWSYDGLSSDKKDVARFTPARYSQLAVAAFTAICKFVESGPLGQAVTQQHCAMRVAGFLIENAARKVLRSQDPSHAVGKLSKCEIVLAAHHRIMGSAAALEHRTRKKHGPHAWPSTGMIRPGVPVAGYNHVDNYDHDRSAFVNVVVILTEFGGTFQNRYPGLGFYTNYVLVLFFVKCTPSSCTLTIGGTDLRGRPSGRVTQTRDPRRLMLAEELLGACHIRYFLRTVHTERLHPLLGPLS